MKQKQPIQSSSPTVDMLPPELFKRACKNKKCGIIFLTYLPGKFYHEDICYKRAKTSRQYYRIKERLKKLKNAEQ